MFKIFLNYKHIDIHIVFQLITYIYNYRLLGALLTSSKDKEIIVIVIIIYIFI